MAGKKVCLIDADPQGSLTVSLEYPDPDSIPQTLATIMMGIINEEEFPKEFAMLHHEEDVDIVPANMELSGLEVSLSNDANVELKIGYFTVTEALASDEYISAGNYIGNYDLDAILSPV